MGRMRPAGLVKRGDIWHIDKRIGGRRLCESTGETELDKAELYLAMRIERARRASIYGERPKRTFRDAVKRYLRENQHKRSIDDDELHVKQLDPLIGNLDLRMVHMGTLQPFIAKRQRQGKKTKTINIALAVVRRILNLAASQWMDEYGLTWLERPPKITLLKVTDARKPYPLSWEEQTRLLKEMPDHLARMALFKVNTGCREQEVCSLRWEWEVEVPELETSVFIIPEALVKNGEERLVVLNRIAKSVVDGERGKHEEYVFTWRGRRLGKMNTTSWRQGRARVGLPQVRVHDLKHTFGRRLRAAGVSFEDRQDLLGHRSGRITTHYSAAELENLLYAANQVVGQGSRKAPALLVLKKKAASA
ncbi:tyrosine-type recombinase/integrase [Lentisalinibacter salinarum]|uniref:tyrosine-type recombinase/integrase n=1 Tax=Lentisalinibacter salinarum TaxID=2992239 RepID=UPI00386B1E52